MGKSVEIIGDWLTLIRRNDRDLLDLCRLDSFRGSGRGGQKRNKTANAVRLTIGDIAVTESATRSRSQNITAALRKLRLKIALSLSSSVARRCFMDSLPDETASYFQHGLIRINTQNPDFPVLAGYLVDLFLDSRGSWRKVAEKCGVSSSQLRRFVEKHPALLSTVRKIQGEVGTT